MKNLLAILSLLAFLPGCSQTKNDRQVGGRCEGCELMFLGMPSAVSAQSRIAPGNEPGESLSITGVVFRSDGKTPAGGVVVYFYHTDANGLYSPGKTEASRTRHGRLRGWVRSDESGKYTIHSIRPASYPDSRAPQHIHALVKEDGLAPYWIDEYCFEDDPFIDDAYKKAQQHRGGDGVIALKKNEHGTWEGKRDIILGKNIPGY